MGNLDVMTVVLSKLLGLDPLNIPGPVMLLGFAMTIMLATGTVWIVWRIMTAVFATAAEMLEIQTTKQQMVIARGLTRHDYEQVRKGIKAWYLLLVRYGTEDYLRTMSGEADRSIGRPRYSTLPMKLSLSPTGEVTLRWSLPLHRRLGTQFRCFIDLREGGSGPGVLTGMLKHYDEIEVLETDVHSPKRVYFLLKRFRMVTTVEGIRQNFVLPE
jgi:hypothetical protein